MSRLLPALLLLAACTAPPSGPRPVSPAPEARAYVPQVVGNDRLWFASVCAWLGPGDFPHRPLALARWCGGWL